MKTFVVTGATGAVGQSAVASLASRGPVHLVLVGRNNDKLKDLQQKVTGSANKIDVANADLSDVSSVKNLVRELRDRLDRLDALINIAAVYKSSRVLSPQLYETMFATNHLGPFVLSTGLLDLISRTPGSKVFTVAAPTASRIDFTNLNGEKKFSSLDAFQTSKMMNLLMSFGLSARFKNSSHASIAFHPGLVKSELLNEGPFLLKKFLGLLSGRADRTGKAIADLVYAENASDLNGKFYNNKLKEMKAASHAYDRVLQQQLWEASETLATRN